jgi:hypothetical protein
MLLSDMNLSAFETMRILQQLLCLLLLKRNTDLGNVEVFICE